MFRKLKIGYKITALVITVVLISVLTVSMVAFNLSKNSIEKRYTESIQALTKLKGQKISAFFEQVQSNLTFGAKLQTVREKLEKVSPTLSEDIRQLIEQTEDSTRADSSDLINQELLAARKALIADKEENMQELFGQILSTYDIENVFLTNKEGIVVFRASADGNHEQGLGIPFNDPDGNTLNVARDSVYFSNIYPENNQFLLLASTPVLNQDKIPIGILIYQINMSRVFSIAQDTTGLGNSGKVVIGKAFESSIIYRTSRTSFSQAKVLPINAKQGKAIQQASQAETGVGYTTDYENEEVLAAWTFIPNAEWGLSIQVSKQEILLPSYLLAQYLAVTGFAISILALVLGIILSQNIVQPILYLREVISHLSEGILPEKLRRTTGDEIGEMTEDINELVDNLQETAQFARSIGRGDYEANFKPAGERDTLGVALLSMRDSIQQAARKDEERNWIVTGLAEIGDILPSISNIEELGDLVSEYVANKIGAVQGAFYTINDDNPQETFIEMKASYAYKKKKYLKAKFRFAEGLVGQAAIEQDTILRTEIPEDYMSISSGILGDQKPKCILITPLITNETVYGVLEFAGFERFNSREINFVEEISELIARTVFNIKVRENTEKLLQESNERGRKLQEQQEILRQNAEIMEATSEELQRTNQELEKQISEVRKAQDRTQLLLENASEVITIYRENLEINYISPSVEKILGYNVDEMIGICDIIYVHPESLSEYERMFAQLLEEPDKQFTIEFQYQNKQKEYIWVEATGTNLLSDPAIQGLVLNMRDITERKAVEREQRLRGQMQALSENSPDLITRITKEGTVFYINPTIESYTGNSKEDYLQKNIDELDLNEQTLSAWKKIVSEAISKNDKINQEMDFSSVIGDRVMQVNAIPEYNEQEQLESVLLVSHDITERKIIELEIYQKNRKITESINYAKRIQDSIIPDMRRIQESLEHSFVLFKPRDVVSGDFPWFLQKDDDIYIAAVDCTGHGVPGALMSLIGFFLLNNIVNTKNARSSGEILDYLDADVTETLGQGENDNAAKDGMDISLCRINKNKKQIEYAGAHRPLYYMSEDRLIEIKGNKFPIGGAQYKNRGRFTNTIINYQEGESVYLFSDGFPDQFGGAKNKKFSPRRIRDMIRDNENLTPVELGRLMDKEFENWRGSNKQTDDVLMIGIKF